ncbi:MAG: FCD domain-containing protein [Eubacteriales bacterium]|nr:FCD domain-containing protein [Eubacteriales bacterium]
MRTTEYKTIKKYKMENKKTYQYVFDYFSEQILSGTLKVNDKIPPEREIAEKLNVSRNSIREVMHMLEINGILDCKQGRGNYVRCEPKDYMVKFVNMIMALQDIKYTEVYHIRTGYELVALRLAIQSGSEEEIEEIHQILLQMDETEDSSEAASLDIEFHNKLIEISHNRLLIMYNMMLSDLMTQFIADFRTRIVADKARGEVLKRAHWNIYDALVDKDFLGGSAAMRKHFDLIGEQIKLMEEEARIEPHSGKLS